MNARIKNRMATGVVSRIAAVVIMGALVPCASAATAIFQNGLNDYAGTEDNQILDPGTGFDNANVGGRNTFQLGNGSPVSTRRLLLRFDVSSLAGKFTSIDSATITLKKANGPAGSGIDDAEMYAIADNNADWVEGNSMFVVTNGQSSWNSKKHNVEGGLWIGDQPSDPFTSGGGGALGALQDTLVGVSSNDPVNTLYTWDLDPALVTQWVNGINAGVLFKEAIENDGIGTGTELQLDFYSSEYGNFFADAPQHPKLEVHFTPLTLAGDFDESGTVDIDDYTVWKSGFGIVYDAADYTIWRNNLGASNMGVGIGSVAIPEPSTVISTVLCLGLLIGTGGRRRNRYDLAGKSDDLVCASRDGWT